MIYSNYHSREGFYAEAEPEVEEETDLFLKTVAKTLCGLLCVLDNVVN